MTRKSVMRAAALPMAISTALGYGGAATAQENQSRGLLEEIIVTAQFREENVQQTPLSISAFDASMLEARSNNDISDAANFAPNVMLSNAATGFGQMSSIFIRGVGQADPHFAVEPGVGMYIDDVYFGVLTGAMFDLVDAERVEVLRGPQGTLAGKNSIGGSIRLFSVQPGPESNAYAEIGVGTYDGLRARAGTNLTLVEDKLYARVSVLARQRDGYVDRLDHACFTGALGPDTQRINVDCTIGTQGGEELVAARAAFRWTPSDRIENSIIMDFTQDDSENPAGVQIVQGPWAGTANYVVPRGSYVNFENYQSIPGGPNALPAFVMPATTPLDAFGISNKLDVQIGDNLNFTSITAYRESTVPFVVPNEFSPASISDQLWKLSHEQITQEFRVIGGNPDGIDWTVGAYHYDADGLSGGRIQLPGGFEVGGGGLNLDFLLNDPVETTSDSVFGHLAFRPGDRITVTTGVRYTDDKKAFTFNRLDVTGGPHPLLGALVDVTSEYSGDRTDYRVAVDYQQSDNLMYYAQFSTGYKGGGVNPRPFFVSQAVPYDPEELEAFEIGLKSVLADGRVRLNLSAFTNDYQDVQLTLTRCDAFSPFPGAPCAMSANVGDAEIDGFEVEAEIRPTDNLAIDISAGVLDFQYTNVDPATFVTLDMATIYVPDQKYAVGIQYDFLLPNGSRLTPRLDYSHRSEIQTLAINTPLTLIDDLDLANLRLTWESADDVWRATLAVTNLTDEYYFTGLFGNGQAVNFSQTAYLGRPREAWLSLRRAF